MGFVIIAVIIAVYVLFKLQYTGEKVYYTKVNQTIEVVYKIGEYSSNLVHHNYIANGWVVKHVEKCYFK